VIGLVDDELNTEVVLDELELKLELFIVKGLTELKLVIVIVLQLE
jgi:hypothetical protein